MPIVGHAQAAWFCSERSLAPPAPTLSAMLIPMLSVFGGALWPQEVLHWQDNAAVLLMAVPIASVLWPQRTATP